MNIITPLSLLPLFFFGILGTLVAQDKNIHIMYNTEVVLANVDDSANVKFLIRNDPDYLKGYKLVVHDYGQKIENESLPRFLPNPYRTVVTISDDINVDKVATKTPINTANFDYNSISFEPGYATLSDLAIANLNYIIAQNKSIPTVKIRLVALTQTENVSVLLKNRFNSIQQYLNLKGIAKDRIETKSLVGNVDLDEIKIIIE